MQEPQLHFVNLGGSQYVPDRAALKEVRTHVMRRFRSKQDTQPTQCITPRRLHRKAAKPTRQKGEDLSTNRELAITKLKPAKQSPLRTRRCTRQAPDHCYSTPQNRSESTYTLDDGTEPVIDWQVNLDHERIEAVRYYPIEVKPYMHKLVVHFCSFRNQGLLPLEFNEEAVTSTKNTWISVALKSATIFHSLLFVAALHYSVLHGSRDMATKAQTHKVTALRLINENMKDPVNAVGDDNITAVITIAIFEVLLGNQGAWDCHMKGVAEMIRVRGGLEALQDNSFLSQYIPWADQLGASLTEQKPRFRELISTDLIIKPATSENLHPVIKDHRDRHQISPTMALLVHNCCLLSDTLETIDNHHSSYRQPPVAKDLVRKRVRNMLRNQLGSVEASKDTKPVYESSTRLGAMIFNGSILEELPIHRPENVKLAYQLYIEMLVLEKAGHLNIEANFQLSLWLSMIGAIAAAEPARSWFLETMRRIWSRSGVAPWDESQSTLKRFLWVERFCNFPFRKFWIANKRLFGEERLQYLLADFGTTDSGKKRASMG